MAENNVKIHIFAWRHLATHIQTKPFGNAFRPIALARVLQRILQNWGHWNLQRNQIQLEYKQF